VVAKAQIGSPYNSMGGQALTKELIIRLTFRASELDISNDILIIDGATPSFCRALRIEFSKRCKLTTRIRPFKKIVGGASRYEDGLQLADMIAGAVRLHGMGAGHRHFEMIANKCVDLWHIPGP
jgi:hypothetical protein